MIHDMIQVYDAFLCKIRSHYQECVWQCIHNKQCNDTMTPSHLTMLNISQKKSNLKKKNIILFGYNVLKVRNYQG